MVNVPPGTTNTFKLRLTKKAKNFVKKTNAKRLQGSLEVRNISGGRCQQHPDHHPAHPQAEVTSPATENGSG
ncbi:MAG: hypothetical protein M3495_07450, partial [Pseudomonadota bacterium]|nr:hypothetical protein [Pseudomonadota bacterium]